MRKSLKMRVLAFMLAVIMVLTSGDLSVFASDVQSSDVQTSSEEKKDAEDKKDAESGEQKNAETQKNSEVQKSSEEEHSKEQKDTEEKASTETGNGDTSKVEDDVKKDEQSSSQEDNNQQDTGEKTEQKPDTVEKEADDNDEKAEDDKKDEQTGEEEEEKVEEETEGPEETEEETDEETEDEESNETETMNTLLVISWLDGSNVSDRRPEHIRDLIRVYADGEKLDDAKLDIHMLNKDSDGDGKADPDKSYGLETYFYEIQNLPVYAEASNEASDEQEETVKKEKITYTVKEETSEIKGYRKIDTDLLDFSDGKPGGSLLSPGDELTLKEYDGDKDGVCRFVNYLPEYAVSGSITWKLGDDESLASDVISMETYFKNMFTVRRGGQEYGYHTITYSEDAEDANIWNYSIAGLFTTDKSGSAVSYALNPAEIEGLSVSPASEEISHSRENVDFTYSLNTEEIETTAEGDEQEQIEEQANEPTTEYTYAGTASAKVVWYDPTGSANNEHPGQLGLTAAYQIDGVKAGSFTLAWDSTENVYYHVYTEAEAKALGVKAGEKLIVRDTGENSLNRTLRAEGLTDTIKTTTTDIDGNENTTTKSVTWSIDVTSVNGKNPEEAITGYSFIHTGDEYRMYPLTTVKVTVDVRSGDDEITDAWMNTYYRDIALSSEELDQAHAAGEVNQYSVSSMQSYFQEKYGSTSFASIKSVDADGKEVIELTGVPYFNDQKEKIEYSFRLKGPISAGTGSEYEYKVEFDNTSVPGHGTNTTEAYNGGTIILTKTGITDYHAYKIWQDEVDEDNNNIGTDRPDSSWTLWRYSDNGSNNYATAAQVFFDADGSPMEVVSVGYDTDGKEIEGSSQELTVAGGTWNPRKYTLERFDLSNLPAYDAEGYTYVYFARESMKDDSYTRNYGSKDGNGYFDETDVLPEGITARAEKDSSVYNNGAISNRKEAETQVSATKKWIAAYYQEKLSNIEVELTLMARHKNSDLPEYGKGEGDASSRKDWYYVKRDGGNAVAADGSDRVTITLSGFDSHNLTKTGSVPVNQYCDNGHLLEFQWVETKVYECTYDDDGNVIERKEIEPYEGTDANGNTETRYQLTINKETLEKESYVHEDEYFVSEGKTEEDGSYVITNTLVGTTEYYVQKLWNGLDASAVTISLEQYDVTGTLVNTIEKTLSDQTPVSEQEAGQGLAYGGNYSSKDSGWVHLYEDLPKYDENGNLYSYVVRECDGGYGTDYSYGYDADGDGTIEKNSVRITNSVGPGVSKHINVRKVWLDDSETKDRAACYFAVYTEDDILLYGNVDGEQGLISSDFVVVSDGNAWWKRIDVTVFSCKDENGNTLYLRRDGSGAYVDGKGLLYGTWEGLAENESPAVTYETEKEWQTAHLYTTGFRVAEYSVGENVVHTEEGSLSALGYPTVQSGDSYYAVIYNHENPDGSRDNYKATNIEDSLNYYTVLNRRVGTMTYTIQKKWEDGTSTDEMRQKWNATLTLSCDEDETAVYDKDGKGHVALPVNADHSTPDATGEILLYEQSGDLPVLNASGDPVSITQSLGYTDGSWTETVTYSNLQMYDVYGRLIHYSVTEKMNDKLEGEHGQDILCEYTTSYGDTVYTTETTGDRWIGTEKQTITNTLTGEDTYTWYLLWLDAYRDENNQRPDVYLQLYYTEYEYDEEGNLVLENGVPKYTIKPYDFKEYLWNSMDGAVGNAWSADFTLPKYDSHGTNIRYYSSIDTGTHDHFILDYISPQFATGAVDDLNDFTSDDANQCTVSYDEDTGKYTVNYNEGSSIIETYMIGGEKIYLMEANNTFVNQLKEDVTIIGSKVWENLPIGYPAEELPKLTFNLYRLQMNADGAYKLIDGNTTKDYPDSGKFTSDHGVLDAGGKRYLVELVSAIKDVVSTGYTYDFRMGHVGYNDVQGESVKDEGGIWNAIADKYGSALPKYDESGNMYKYVVVETMAEDAHGNIDTAYDELSGAVNGYNVKNVYNTDTNKAGITLQKDWKSQYEEHTIKDYPDTTYTLYRFYRYTNEEVIQEKNSSYSAPEKIASLNLSAKEAENGSVDFGEQLIYSPNTTPYIYFIVEKPVNGYENTGFVFSPENTSVRPEAGSTGWPSADNGTYFPEMSTDNGWGSKAFTLAAGAEGTTTGIWQRILQFFGLRDATPTVAVTTENLYTGMPQAKVSGTKIWDDDSDMFGTRPTVLELKLYRYLTETDPEEMGTVTLTISDEKLTAEWKDNTSEGTPKNVTGKITASAEYKEAENKWIYTIDGLDGYYTSGEEYHYGVWETCPKNYTSSPRDGIVIEKSAKLTTDENGGSYRDIVLNDLKNANRTTASVEKIWDGPDTLLALPEVQVELQVGIENDDTTEWYWAQDYFAKEYPDFVYNNYVQTLNHGNGWKCSYANLPKGYGKDADYKTFRYRGAEIRVGGIDVNYELDGQDKRTTTLSGNQMIPYTITQGDTAVTNKADSTQITVTKYWENDSDNAYSTRGDVDGDADTDWSVAYHVYRSRVDSSYGAVQVEQVMKADGTPYVLYVSGSNTDSSRSATSVEMPAVSPDGTAYTYYAVELNPSGIEVSANGDGTVIYNGTYTVTSNTNRLSFTNRLKTTELTVTKKWENDFPNMRYSIPLKLYRYIEEDKQSEVEIAYSYPTAMQLREENNWTAKFTGLPKYDREGNLYHYYVLEFQQTGYEEPAYTSDVDGVGPYNVTITNTATQITLDKSAEDNSKVNNVTLVFESVNKISGYYWTLTWNRDKDGKESYAITASEDKTHSKAWTSGEADTGSVMVTGLPTGTYQLTAESVIPNGYAVPSSLSDAKFTIDAKGTISNVSGSLSRSNANLTLTLTDPKTSVTLKKTNKDGSQILDDYTFSVEGQFRATDATTTQDTRYIGTVPTGKTGLADGMLLVSDTSGKSGDNWQPAYLYTLKEITAPTGYTVSDYTVMFYLDEYGNVVIHKITDKDGAEVSDDQWSAIAAANGHEITFKDDPFEMKIVKNGTGGEENLGGAKFTLSKRTDDGWPDVAQDLTTETGVAVTIDSVAYQLSVDTIYRVTETKAPDGYILPSTVKENGEIEEYLSYIDFKVDKDGTVRTGTVGEDGVFTENTTNPAPGNTLTFTDNPISVSIVKVDYSKEDKTLSGVEFELYKVKEGTEELISGITLRTDDNGTVTIPSGVLAYDNTYKLYEKSYVGYVEQAKKAVYEFRINANGTVTPTGDYAQPEYAFGSVDNTTANHATITLKNTRIAGNLTVTKVDNDDHNKTLPDAEFTLYTAVKEGNTWKKGDKATGVFNGTETTDTRGTEGDPAHPNPVTTDGNGVAVFKDLPWGTYILEETKAPSGYKRQTDTWVIPIGDTGTNIRVTASETVYNTKNSISFQKYDVNDTTKSLAGAVFALKPATGSIFAKPDVLSLNAQDPGFAAKITSEGSITWTTVKDKPIVFDGYLVAGDTYTLTETTAPTGYKLNTTAYTFTVNEDGTIRWSSQTGVSGAGLTETKDGVNVYDTPIAVTLEKQDSEDSGVKLKNAEFSLEVYDTTENKWGYVKEGDKDIDGESSKLVTAENGTVQLTAADGSSLVTSETWYRLTETGTPNGYIVTEPKISAVFEVQTDGTVLFARTADTAFSKDETGETIIVKNTKTKLYLEKLDNETGKILTDARIEVYRESDFMRDADNRLTQPKDGASPIMPLISGTHMIEEGLTEGERYVLYESVTPAGYDSFAPVEFKLVENNVVELADDTRTDVRLSEDPDEADNYTIYVDDTRIRGHVELTKLVDLDGDGAGDKTVAGVEFSLYRVNGEQDVKAGTANSDQDTEDTLIASELTVDQNGKWTSKDNQTDTFMDTDGTQNPFATGLPTGTYYFVETKATFDTALHPGQHSFTIGDSDTGAHGKQEEVTVTNEVFHASVTLTKLDEISGKGISNVGFTLEYIPEGKGESAKLTFTGKTDKKGVLTFDDLQKGSYKLTETAAAGYDISQTHDQEHLPFIAEFTIGDSALGKTIMINSAAAEDEDLQMKVVQGSLNEKGITNARLLGSVILHKADGDNVAQALNGVEFTLYRQKESGSVWEAIGEFFTGKSYTKEGSWTGKELGEAGTLVIGDLDWGTYKLIETKAKDGYATTDAGSGKAIETVEFTFDRESGKLIELNADGESFCNYQTTLQIRKQSEDGEALPGAVFALTGRYVNEAGETVHGTMRLTTDEQGVIELKGVLIGGETYTLTETEAPEGYQLLKGSLSFEVQKDGTVTVTENVSGYTLTKFSFFDNQITVVDQKIPDKEDSKTDKKKSSKTSIVKTGDSSSIGLLLLLWIVSAAALLWIGFRRRRKQEG